MSNALIRTSEVIVTVISHLYHRLEKGLNQSLNKVNTLLQCSDLEILVWKVVTSEFLSGLWQRNNFKEIGFMPRLVTCLIYTYSKI